MLNRRITLVGLAASLLAVMCTSALGDHVEVADLIARERLELDKDSVITQNQYDLYLRRTDDAPSGVANAQAAQAAYLVKTIEYIRADVIDEALEKPESRHSICALKHALYKAHHKAYALISADLDRLTRLAAELGGYRIQPGEIIDLVKRYSARARQYDDGRFACNEVYSC